MFFVASLLLLDKYVIQKKVGIKQSEGISITKEMRSVSTLYHLILCISIENKQQFCLETRPPKKCNFKL